MIKTVSTDSATLILGDVWLIDVRAVDGDGCPVTDTVVVTVTEPDGTTATPTVTDRGVNGARAEYVTAAAGRHVAVAVGAYGVAEFTAWVETVTTAEEMPVLADLVGNRGDDEPVSYGYLGQNSATDEQVQDALDAEAAAQRRVCRVPAAYGADLRQALLRRVARNLALRRIPLAVLQGDADAGSLVPPGRDPEVRRFEGFYRKLTMG